MEFGLWYPNNSDCLFHLISVQPILCRMSFVCSCRWRFPVRMCGFAEHSSLEILLTEEYHIRAVGGHLKDTRTAEYFICSWVEMHVNAERHWSLNAESQQHNAFTHTCWRTKSKAFCPNVAVESFSPGLLNHIYYLPLLNFITQGLGLK